MKFIKKFLDVRTFFLVAFPFAVVFSFIPSELYFNNLKDWGGDYFLLLYFAGVGLILSILLYFGICAVEKIFHFKVNFLAYWLFIFGVYFLVSDIFSPLQLGLLDGTDVLSDEPVLYTLIEFFLLFLCFWSGVHLSDKSYRDWCVGFSIAAIFIFGGYLVYCVQYSKAAYTPSIVAADDGQNTSSDGRPNIYHIVLDAMQTDYFLEVLNRSDYSKKLTGFNLFKNNISSYPYTSASSASYLGGTVYTGGSYSQWTSDLDDSLFNLADRDGYAVHVYGKPSVIQTASAVSYVSQDTIVKEYYGLNHPLLKEFVRLWSARISPNFMTNEALVYGSMLGDFISSFFNNHDGNLQPKTIAEGIEPYTGVLMLKDVIKTEKTRPDASMYLYAHPILPHGPYVLDESCNYSKGMGGDVANKCLGQSECAIFLLCEFIDELRSLRRFDKSLIVVHSDHGSGWESSGFYSPASKIKDRKPYRKNIGRWSKHHLESRSMALLMIKPPFSNSELNIIDVNSQLLDVYPTILDYAGIQYDYRKAEGFSLKSCISNEECEKHETRDRFFYYFPPSGPSDGLFEKLKIKINEIGRPEFFQAEKVELERQYLNIGSHVSFSINGEGGKYLRRGWSEQEASHIWSNAERAQLKFRLSDKVNHSLKLKLYANGFPADGRDPQNVNIYANGEKIGFWQVLNLAWYEITIPKNKIVNETLDITFEISNPTAPCEVSDSKDCRKLGIAVKELVIARRNENP